MALALQEWGGNALGQALDDDEKRDGGEDDQGEGPGSEESEDQAGEGCRHVLDEKAGCERARLADVIGIARGQGSERNAMD